MKAHRLNRRSVASWLIGLVIVSLVGGIAPVPAQARPLSQVGTYKVALVPHQVYIIQRGKDHARIVYTPPDLNAIAAVGSDRPTILINCRTQPRWDRYDNTMIRAGIDADLNASVVGTRLKSFELWIHDFGNGVVDTRQWVVTFPVEGNNQTPHQTCFG